MDAKIGLQHQTCTNVDVATDATVFGEVSENLPIIQYISLSSHLCQAGKLTRWQAVPLWVTIGAGTLREGYGRSHVLSRLGSVLLFKGRFGKKHSPRSPKLSIFLFWNANVHSRSLNHPRFRLISN
jgi:hypothetical protein